MTLEEIIDALNGLTEDERRKVFEASVPDGPRGSIGLKG